MSKGIQHLAETHPSQQFSWTHFGDGPLKTQLEKVSQGAPPNLAINLMGKIPNKNILEYYANNPVDLFINMSKSEGMGVAIMEAQSFGIPVVAPHVGGIPEIVSSSNGHLLSPEPSIEEISKAIWNLYTTPDYEQKRIASRETWSQKFDASENYANFVQKIVDIFNDTEADRMNE